MLIVSFIQWWYGRGFREYLQGFVDHLRDAADFFSMRLLIRNLFAPFRQIAAQKDENLSLNMRFHAWVDLMISRFVGATIRFLLLIIGTIVLIIRVVIGVVLAVAWPLMPALIVAVIVLYIRGVVF